jgi:hypothetical protein
VPSLGFETWEAFYRSGFQSLWALLVAPALFLALRLAAGARESRIEPIASAFVDRYAIVFAVEALVDPIANGPLVRALGWSGTGAASLLLFVFVWLGDFRVFALAFGLGAGEGDRPRALVGAAAASFAVPVFAGLAWTAAHAALPELDGQWLWVAYELAFLCLALALRARLSTARLRANPALAAFVRALWTYVAVYYALWAAADLLVLAGLDLGWALRALPNQLYYGLWVPFVWVRFFVVP